MMDEIREMSHTAESSEGGCLVSVIVPVYNTELYLEECLGSILRQTLKEFELICVDDGSTDRSPAILQKIAAEDARVRILTQANQYAGAARNRGLREARGEYVMFLDSDDFFEETMLEDMYAQCRKDDAQICICNGQIYEDNTGKYRSVRHYIVEGNLPKARPFSRKDIPEKILNVSIVAPWNKMFQRQYLLEQGLSFQELRRANDVYFGCMAMALADRITVCNKVLANYRSGHSSSLQANKDDSPLDFYDALTAVMDGLKSAQIYYDIKKSFANYCIACCFYNLDGVKTGAGYSAVYRKLTEEGFDRLELAGHTGGYFYRKDFYSRMLDMLESDPEVELFDRMKRAEEELTGLKQGIFADESFFSGIPLDGETKVSVIIPVYNTEEYLEQCVRSVMNQTLENIEIICVNDGSTDRSAAILRELKQQDARIRVFSKKNGGQSAARNMGMKRAVGEYLLFLDSDDCLEADALRMLYCYASYFALDELFYGGSTFYETEKLKKAQGGFADYYHYRGSYPYVESGRSFFVKTRQNEEFKPSVCMQLFKRELIEANHLSFYEGILHEDVLFTMQCLALAKRVRVLNRPFYKRRVREGSTMTIRKDFRHVYGRFTAVREMLAFIVQHELAGDREYYNALMQWLAVVCRLASKDLSGFEDREILDFAAGLDAKEQSLFMLLIYHMQKMRIREQKEAEARVRQTMNDLHRQIHLLQLKAGEESLQKGADAKVYEEWNRQERDILFGELEAALAEKESCREENADLKKENERLKSELTQLHRQL